MKLILIRHGECERLTEGIYNGWSDYGLTQKGIKQAQNVGNILKNNKITIDIIYTSALSRTIETAKNILNMFENNKDLSIECISTYLLNERHYGAFQGKTKNEILKNFKYRYTYENMYDGTTKPPEISNDEYNTLIEKYSKILNLSEEKVQKIVPKTESLKDVENRVDNFFNKYLKQYVKENINRDKTIIVVSHANTLKVIVKKIEKIKTYQAAMKNLFATCGIYEYNLDDESFLNNEYIINSKKILNNNWYA